MKESRVTSRYYDIMQVLSKKRDPSRRRLLFKPQTHKIERMLGTSRMRIEHEKQEFLNNEDRCDAAQGSCGPERYGDVILAYVEYRETDKLMKVCRVVWDLGLWVIALTISK